MTGRKTGTNLRPLPQVKRFNLFVSRIETGVLPETLKSFVSDLISDVCSVQCLKTRLPDYLSYIVSCDDRHMDTIMNPDEWPEGVLIEQYTVQPAYMEQFGTAKTIPYIQKNYIREVHLYIYTFSEVLHPKHKNLFARHYSRRFLLLNFLGHMTKEV